MKKRYIFIAAQLLLTVAIVLAGFVVAKRLVETKPRIKKVRPVEPLPSVSIKLARPERVRVEVPGDGTVRPSKEVEMVPQVSGKVVYVSKDLVTGGRFKEGELLVRIEDSDYVAALKKAEAELKTLKAKLYQLKEESEVARAEWEDLNPGEDPPPLLLKLPDIKAVEAQIVAAQAAIEKARLDLKCTEIRAPFSGVVISEDVDVGQFVRAGEPLARISSDESAEVKVNLREDDVAYINIPGFNSMSHKGSPAVVELSMAGKTYRWKGYVHRAEIMDEKTRTLPVVVRVDKPYSTIPPLSVGAFVRVRIEGRSIDGATVIERSAIEWSEEGKPFLWLVDDKGRLLKRRIEVVRPYRDRYIIKGLKGGERFVVTPPPAATEGMKVRIGR